MTKPISCCIHGLPCVIAQQLNEKKRGTETDICGYEFVKGQGPNVAADDISYGLSRKVERVALDVPRRSDISYGTPPSTNKTLQSRLTIQVEKKRRNSSYNSNGQSRSSEQDRSGYERVRVNDSGQLPLDDELSYGLNRKVEKVALDIPFDPRIRYDSTLSEKRRGHRDVGVQAYPYEKNISDDFEDTKFTRHRVEKDGLEQKPEAFSPNVKRKSRLRQRLPISGGYETVKPRLSISKVEHISTNGRNIGSEEENIRPIMVYIGVKCPKEAESFITEPSSFKIYHRIPERGSLDGIPAKIPLTIAYRSNKDEFFHYPITLRRRYMETPVGSGRLIQLNTYQVDYGDRQTPAFSSIDALIQYYNSYVHQIHHNDDGVFP